MLCLKHLYLMQIYYSFPNPYYLTIPNLRPWIKVHHLLPETDNFPSPPEEPMFIDSMYHLYNTIPAFNYHRAYHLNKHRLSAIYPCSGNTPSNPPLYKAIPCFYLRVCNVLHVLRS